jgi:hypothetical protein
MAPMPTTTAAMMTGRGSAANTPMYPALPTLMAAAATTAIPITSRPTAADQRSDRKPSRTYAASPAATGMRPPSSANEAPVSPIRTAAATNASGAIMPARPAAAPIST